MGKLLLSVVLLVMIVAVSYIQAVRKQTKIDNSFQLGVKSNQREVLALESTTDSLRTRLGAQEVEYAESLLTRDKIIKRNTDSLATIISAQDKSISELKKKANPRTSISQKSTDSAKRHQELLAYYKKRYESLPGDLTEYERKVAVNEIRHETAAKYSITVAEFNRIRDNYKVTY